MATVREIFQEATAIMLKIDKAVKRKRTLDAYGEVVAVMGSIITLQYYCFKWIESGLVILVCQFIIIPIGIGVFSQGIGVESTKEDWKELTL